MRRLQRASFLFLLCASVTLLASPTHLHAATLSDFQSGTDNANQATYTVSNVSIGTPASNRYVILGVTGRNAGDTLSVTIGGVSATELADIENLGANGALTSSLWIANVPTGTSTAFVVTFEGTSLRLAWNSAVAPGIDPTPYATSSDDFTDNGGLSLASTIDVPDHGVVFGYSGLGAFNSQSPGDHASWTGLTEQTEVLSENVVFATGASLSDATVETGRSVSVTYTLDSGNPNDAELILASFEEAQVTPAVTTNAATGIGPSTATLNADIADDGGASITQHGFAYATTSDLSTGVSTTTLGAGAEGAFNQPISTLAANTTYYFRAYATNSNGTGYGSILSFTTESGRPPVLVKPPNNLGLVGYWSFNDGSGTTATDFSGNGNTGTLTNGPTWTNGKRGAALLFDGTDDYVAIGDTAANVQTVSFWTKAGDTTSRKILDFDGGTHIIELDGSSQVAATGFVSPTTYVDGSSDPATLDARWHHVVVTTATPFAASAVSIGRVAAEYFAGVIDDVRLYSRALSANEVARLYGSGAVKVNASSADLDNDSSLETGLVGHWTFDGKDTQATIADASGNANHGFFVGGATSSAKVAGKLGQALQFDGSNDYVQINNVTGIPAVNAAQTIAAWLKYPAEPDSDQSILTFRNSAPNGANHFVFTAAGDFQIDRWGGGTIHSINAPSAKQWHQIVWTTGGDGTTGILYVDGVQADTDTTNQQNGAVARIYFSTYNGSDEHYEGLLDDIRIYNRVLSPAEVQQLYKLGTVAVHANPFAP